jgi:hypothetical protein
MRPSKDFTHSIERLGAMRRKELKIQSSTQYIVYRFSVLYLDGMKRLKR